jgi:hypothetical protein
MPLARHQSRFLVNYRELISGEGLSLAGEACIRLQTSHMGAVFISVPADPQTYGTLSPVQHLLLSGFSPHLVTVFRQGSVARPVIVAGRTFAEGALEILAVGATEVSGYSPRAVTAVAELSRTVNRRLGRAELAVPRLADLRAAGTGPSVAAGGPEGLGIPGGTEPRLITAAAAGALLAEGERKIMREYEQRLDILDELEEQCAI